MTFCPGKVVNARLSRRKSRHGRHKTPRRYSTRLVATDILTMSAALRLAPRLRPAMNCTAVSARAFSNASERPKDMKWAQNTPLGAYYESVLNSPPPYPFVEKPEEPASSADPEVLPPGKNTPESSNETPGPTKKKPGRKPKSDASVRAKNPTPSPRSPTAASSMALPPLSSPQEKARIIFGSRLTAPQEHAERLAAKKAQSTYIAGVLVPPVPEEPDNCCMSGCVNCVWDQYRDEMEEWAAKKNEARARLREGGGSMDGDGAPAGLTLGDTGIAKNFWDEEALQSVPVGIREFMKTEKRLKDRHAREGTRSG